MRKHSILFVLIVLFSQFCAWRTFAQTITGPTSLFAGSTGSFTLYDDVVLTNPNWSVDNGVLLSETHSGLNHSASIRFDCPGTSTVTLRDGSTVLYTLPLVTVTCRSVTTPSTTFTYVTGCGTGSITRNSSPTSDTWYWQTDPNGTSTSLGSAATLNIATSGTYYLRALKNASTPCCWSATSLATIYVDVSPPIATASALSICSGQSTSIGITGTAGATFAWTVTQTNVSGATSGSGTSISQVLTATSNTTGTAVYRITPTKGSCNGTPLTVTASVKPLPTVSAANQGIFSGQSTSVAITNPNNVSGTTFAWTVNQTNASGGTSGTGSTIVQTLTGSGTASYVITPSAGGCSGVPVTSVVTLHANPTITPSSPRISVGKVTLDGGSGFATYSWKNASNQILSTNQTYATSSPGNYSLTVTKANVVGSANATISLQGQLEGLNMNYLVSNSFLTSVTNESAIPDLPIESRSQTIQYVDGLGRPIQSVTLQGSPYKQDIVQPIIYDDFGREVRKYLPITIGNDGIYKTNLFDANGNYVPTTYANALNKVAMDSKPYSESVLEPSPLSRVIKQGAPGTAWQPNTDPYSMADNTVKKRYQLNTANEVLRLSYDEVTGAVTGTNLYYPANELHANHTYDEHNNEVVEYVDKEGRILCKKVKADATQYAITYYIYDALGNLVVVLPPEAMKAITAN
ncbi:MAG: DUF6443 domain-containing protein [Flammeovirgaceae bacterium]|nr:DUF6443 domain-containing protein [Flammeovirgaceae bacterium]